MEKPLNILIVNDDGYQSEGLHILKEFAKKIGKVTVCAPKTEQSGKSQGINIVTSFEAKMVSNEDGIEVWYVDSTPADCVRFAVNGLHRSFDLVLSGINHGINVGRDILYSGTVGVIFEAQALGIPGIAFSTDVTTFAFAKDFLPHAFDFIMKNRLLDKNPLYNVNIPAEPPRGILLTRQAGPYYLDDIDPDETRENFYVQHGYSVYHGTKDLSLDLDAVKCGYVSITPMSIERTNAALLDSLKNLSVMFETK